MNRNQNHLSPGGDRRSYVFRCEIPDHIGREVASDGRYCVRQPEDCAREVRRDVQAIAQVPGRNCSVQEQLQSEDRNGASAVVPVEDLGNHQEAGRHRCECGEDLTRLDDRQLSASEQVVS